MLENCSISNLKHQCPCTLAGGGDLLGDFLGFSSSGSEGLRRAFLAGGSGDFSSLEDLLAAAFRLTRSRGGDFDGVRLAERGCWRGSGEADGLGDCLAARALGLTSRSGEDEGERLVPWDLATLGGGGEADVERFVRDLVLRTGEAESTCADLRPFGLKNVKQIKILEGNPMVDSCEMLRR